MSYIHIAKGQPDAFAKCKVTNYGTSQAILTIPAVLAEASGINGAAEIHFDPDTGSYKVCPGGDSSTAFAAIREGKTIRVQFRKPLTVDLAYGEFNYTRKRGGLYLDPVGGEIADQERKLRLYEAAVA